MALKPITRQEQIIVGKNLEPITRMERFLKEYGGGSGGGTQSDWNQTDSSAADFIKNRPFGYKMTEIMPETELTAIDNDGIYLLFLESFPEADECHVTFDGVKYTCKKISLDGDIAYGNLSILGAGDDTGEPFILCMGCAIVNDDAPHTVGISEMRATPIDESYLPPRKTFYVKHNDASDIYLYTDEARTTKATMEDVEAADKMHGIRINTDFGMWGTPLVVKTGVSSGSGAHDYAMVGVVKTLNGDTATFAFYYTDKYTAS